MPSPLPQPVSPFLLSHLQALSSTWHSLPPSARLSQLTALQSKLPPPPYPPYLPPLLLQTLSQLLSSTTPLSESVLSTVFSLVSLSSSTRQSTPPPSRSFQLSAAHLLHTLSNTASTHPSTTIRASALSALASLSRYIPPSLLASFLPGLVSSLTKLLIDSAQLHSTLVINGLHALAATFHAFPSPVSLESSIEPALSFQAALHHLSQKPSANATQSPTANSTASSLSTPSPPRSFLINRDDAWAFTAGKELSARLCLVFEARGTPAVHPAIKTRIAVAKFCVHALQYERRLRLTQRVSILLRFVIAQLGGDDFEQVRQIAEEEMRQGKWVARGLRALIAVVVEGKPGGGVEEEGLRAIIRGADEYLWVRLGEGFLRFAVWGPGEDVGRVVRRVGVEGFCAFLVRIVEALWENGTDGDGDSVVANRVLEMSLQMGRDGLLMFLYGELFKRIVVEEDDGEEVPHIASRRTVMSFKGRAYAALVLQAVVRGALETNHDGGAHFRYTMQCVIEVLETSTWFLLPSMDEGTDEGAGLVDDTLITLKRCLLRYTAMLVQEVSRLHEMLIGRPMGSHVVLVILLSLLKDVAHGEEAVRQAALLTLRSVATAARCFSERQLIARHLNFLISRLARHLEERWAGNVLRFIIGSEGDDVSRDATLLLEATLRDICNELAGSADSRALRSLMALKSVLSSAINVTNSLEHNLKAPTLEDEQDTGNVEVSDSNSANLYKRLFYYCTDDIDDYNQLTSVKDDEELEIEDNANGIHGKNGTFLGAFEAVATSTLEGMRDLLVGRPWNVRAAALACATLAVYMLQSNQDELLPHAANLLPLLPDQFVVLNQERSARDRLLDSIKKRKLRGREDAEELNELVLHLNRKAAELPVVTNACSLLTAFAKCAGSFIRHRFVTLIYPKMRPLLRLASCFPTLVGPIHSSSSEQLTAPPSYGAMSASDACLEAVASMADVLPQALEPHTLSLVKYLSVYINAQHDPSAEGQRNVGHLNRSKLRYEQERWQKRVKWAECTIRSLKEVNPGDVLVGLLIADHSAPSEIRPRHSSLHTIGIDRTTAYRK